MIGEACQHLRRRVGDARQPVAQFRQRQVIVTGKQQAHHRIEERDLVFAVAFRIAEKQIGDLTQHRGAPVLGDPR